MNNTLENGKKSLKEVFNGKNYFVIPDYQRAYAWGDKQLKDFFDDFNTKYNCAYYYGTVLLHKLTNESKERFHIIDGQQRLTTLIIFVSCLIKRMKELGYSKEKCDDLRTRFIQKEEYGNYILQLQDEDNDFFDKYVLEDKNKCEEDTPSQKKLFNAKCKLSEWLQCCDNSQIEDMINKIDYTSLIVYLIKSETEAAMIFETTNDRGKPLTNLEKTKSFLMYKAGVLSNDAEQLISTLRNRFNEIYRNYTKVQDVFPNEESILQYSFIANEEWKNTSKKEYQHYMEIMKDKVDAFIKNNDSKGLQKYIYEYSERINEAFKIFKEMVNNPCKEFMDIQAIGNIANFYPLLLKAYISDTTNDKHQFRQICHLCEIFAFRTYVIMKYFASKSQTTFYTMARDFKGDFSKLKTELIKLITNDDFSDDKFINGLKSEKFYLDYHTYERNYFYWKYENYLREHEQPVATLLTHEDLMQKENKKFKLTIEHIVAQKNEEEQSHIISDESCVRVGSRKKFEEELLHSIGNLTIDPQSANSSKQNINVETKISKYFVKSQYKCQLELEKFLVNDKWTHESINKRRDKILEFAKKTWCNFEQFNQD